MKLNILGTEYDYQEIPAKEDIGLGNCNGYCDKYKKIIRIDNDYNENVAGAIKDFDSFKKKVKRHEILHGYLHESGMDRWSDDELFIDWIAVQFPKLLETFNEIGAL